MLFSGRGLFGTRAHAPYEALRHLPPGLMLDIGASNGAFTKLMLSRSPQSTVVAFEPFPGNVPLLRENVGSDVRVQIIDKAVSDVGTDVPFFVSSKVEDGSAWGAGYSSLGHIATDVAPGDARTITVQTIGVDEVVGDRHVVFMKVDVQGGELGVLRSAKNALSERRVDIIYLEFSGERDLFEHVQRLGYVVFDGRYGLIPLRKSADLSRWAISGPMRLSTGHPAHYAWPACMPTTPNDYLDFIERERQGIGNIFTDLVCVSPKALPRFLEAAIATQLEAEPLRSGTASSA